jgi:hypothetical protein
MHTLKPLPALDAASAHFADGGHRAVEHIPVGCGKTGLITLLPFGDCSRARPRDRSMPALVYARKRRRSCRWWWRRMAAAIPQSHGLASGCDPSYLCRERKAWTKVSAAKSSAASAPARRRR